MRRCVARTAAVVALGAALAATPAHAAKKPAEKKQPPEFRTTEYALTEAGNVLVGASVSRADSVTATVGAAGAAHQLKLSPADSSRVTTLWTAEQAQGLEACLPVKFVARNEAGSTVQRDDACVFAVSNPTPPTAGIPFIGLGR